MAAGLDSAVSTIPVQGSSEATGFTAMVVDDHPLIRESMVNRLRAVGRA